MSEIFRAKEPFACADGNGVVRSIAPGALFSVDDPIYKGRRHLFEPVEVAAARAAGVEDATAEPGALRSVSTVRGRGRKAGVEPEPPADVPASESTPEPEGDE